MRVSEDDWRTDGWEAHVKKHGKSMIEQCDLAAQSCGLVIHDRDFLCRVMAIIYCYGGGPGGEFLRTPLGQMITLKAARLIEDAVRNRDWEIVKLFRFYVKELQANNAEWLDRTLERMNIPPRVIKFSECVQPAGPVCP